MRKLPQKSDNEQAIAHSGRTFDKSDIVGLSLSADYNGYGDCAGPEGRRAAQ
jgi:hypothetical protein